MSRNGGKLAAVAADLTDTQVAQRVGKHHARSSAGAAPADYPTPTRPGRSWRIPRAGLRRAQLGAALEQDDYRSELRAAISPCAEIRQELSTLRLDQEHAIRRDWRKLAR
jgi:hypothetical protein